MKILKAIFIIFLIISSLKVNAQLQNAGDLREEVDKVKAPSSPASIVLGNQPGSITRPKSWEALEASVFTNNLNGNGGFTIPNDFALEFSPYWAQKNLNLSVDDFLAPNAGLTLIQNLSFSVSTSQNFVIQDTINTNVVGFGFRTMIWQGTKAEKSGLNNLLTKTRKSLVISNLIFFQANRISCANCNKEIFIDSLVIRIKNNNLLNGLDFSSNEREKFIVDLSQLLLDGLPSIITNSTDLDLISDEVDELLKLDLIVKDLTQLRADRKGFKTELAGALALDFPTNEADFSIIPKSSLWIVPSYQPFNSNWIEVLGLLRYSWYNIDFYNVYMINQKNKMFDHNFDYGLRIAFKKEKFSLEFEGVGRISKTIRSRFIDNDGLIHTISNREEDSQFLLNFNYNIGENIMLSYNFGKQFIPIINYKGTLVSLATLNFGIGAPKKEDIIKTKK